MTKILWLHNSQFTHGVRRIAESFMRSKEVQISPADVAYTSLHKSLKDMWVKKSKTQWTWNKDKKEEFRRILQKYVHVIKPKVIVINDAATLGFITGEYTSLDLCRGSVYYFDRIPCIVVDDVIKTQYQSKKNKDFFKKNPPKKHAPWILTNDLQKIKRWANGNIRPEPKFKLVVCRDLDEIDRCFNFLNECIVAASDIETSHGFISVIGYTGLHKSGETRTYVVPFIDTTNDDRCYWRSHANEEYVWRRIRNFHLSDVYKIFQNGSYDSAYFIKYNIPLRNYILDTQHLFHSIWCEAPKRLNFIASIAVDHCVFWKDEAKGDKKDTRKSEAIPWTQKGLENYWRYNGLDTYFTLLNCIWLVQFLADISWARRNYSNEFGAEMGPAFAASMRGFNLHKGRLGRKLREWEDNADKKLHDLQTMTADDEYNPRSGPETASFLYDVLGAVPIKKRGMKTEARSVDKQLLKFVRLQHPLYAIFIDALNDYKEAKNNVSKYAALQYMDRWMYKLNAGGTETGRYSSSQHQFRLGTQIQNVPASVRDVVIPDEGYFFLEFDYSQSDAWFIAYESQDQAMIDLQNGEKDSHCVVATWFFNKEYEEIYAGYKEGADWVVHPIRGVRQNIKRIRHGCNYRMQGDTLYHHLGHDETIATAIAMGYKDAGSWDKRRLVDFCQGTLIKKYHQNHPGLNPWFRRSVAECRAHGNIASCFGGHTRYFFGDMQKDHAVQRELSAYFGQGGTGGNINRFLRDFYYKEKLEETDGVLFMTQTHDSVLLQIPLHNREAVQKVLTLADKSCTIRGQEFTVPVDAQYGLSWKGGMIPFTGVVDFNAMYRAQEKWQEEKYDRAA